MMYGLRKYNYCTIQSCGFPNVLLRDNGVGSVFCTYSRKPPEPGVQVEHMLIVPVPPPERSLHRVSLYHGQRLRKRIQAQVCKISTEYRYREGIRVAWITLSGLMKHR